MQPSDSRPPKPPARRPASALERLVEKLIFSSRWVLAPIYLGLAGSLVLLLIKFIRQIAGLASTILTASESDIIVGVLSLIDISLMGNLLLMIMLGGYQNFVSRLDFDGHEDKPDWIGHVGFGDMKLKLMASIVAISAIELLRNFMNMEHLGNRELAWSTGIHMSFVVSGVLLALMDWLMSKTKL